MRLIARWTGQKKNREWWTKKEESKFRYNEVLAAHLIAHYTLFEGPRGPSLFH